MLVVMEQGAADDDVAAVIAAIEGLGFSARPIVGAQRTVVGVVGNEAPVDAARFQGMSGVKDLLAVTSPFKLVSREWHPDDSVVAVSPRVAFGGTEIPIIAGPCSVESERQIIETAIAVRAAGATVLRGGAFKPRSSPYSFQGLGTQGLKLLARARAETGLLIVTEAIDHDAVDEVAEHADIIQIGSRNMQNTTLLKRAGRAGRPVLLKRGQAATVKELLLSAEYILAEGNAAVILCERGIRGFDPATRYVLDLTAIPAIKALSHLPVIADPSHGTGVRDLVPPMARAAIAAGADGVMLEVHPDPRKAFSDGGQSLPLSALPALVDDMRAVARAVGRTLAVPAAEPVGA